MAVLSFQASTKLRVFRGRARFHPKTLLTLALLLAVGPARAGSLGDGGHFLSQFVPEIALHNPTGGAFTVTAHRYIWPVSGFNGGFQFTVKSPSGTVVAAVKQGPLERMATLAVPAGEAGVYTLTGGLGGYGLAWLESSLDRLVAKCADTGSLAEGKPGYQAFMLHAMAPRRWTFFVPQGTERFEVQVVLGTYQTHREDYGLIVMNPRGQRVAALYGGVSIRKPRLTESEPVGCVVEPDPGTTGRFWSLWVTGGDSHCYSDLRIVLKGGPPVLAQSPEQWFDPETGTPPPRLIYDESPIRHVETNAPVDRRTGKPRSTDFYRWAPAPFLGDEDYNGVRGLATVCLLNPENRPIRFGAGSYLPPPEGLPIHYSVSAPDGFALLKTNTLFMHKNEYDILIPPVGAGIYRVTVDSPTWYAWSEPAVPMVLEGRPQRGGRHLFRLQVSTGRHWFFRVPKGTARFSVAVRVADPDHVLAIEVHAPDRLIEPAYVRGGQPRTLAIEVPKGLDGMIWFLRTDVGSSTRFLSRDAARPRHTRIDADITLRGVPGYLAPTWEQWFDPEAGT
jgi:hypothetical protein